MADQGIYTILTKAAMLSRFDPTYGPRLMNCWLPAETWVEVLKRTGHIDASLAIDARKSNAAFAKSSSFGTVMSRFDGSNNTGVFHVRFQHRQYYYFTHEKRQVPYPNPLNQAWKLRVLEGGAANVLDIPSTRSRPGLLGESATAVDETPSPNKHPRIEDKEEPEKDQQPTSTTVIYWPHSPEVRQVFQPISTGRFASTRRRSRGIASAAPVGDADTTPECETAKDALEQRIQLLQSANESEDGWRNVILGRDADNYCTKLEILQIRQRSTFLCCANQLALSHMSEVTWHDYCKQACHLLNGLGFKQATFFKTIANRNKVFRKIECFPHPNPNLQCGKRPLPKLLELYPDAKDQIASFGVKNVGTLTIESVHDFIITSILPRLTSTWQKEEFNDSAGFSISTATNTTCSKHDDESTINFLNAHGLELMSLTTTWRWMRLLGFNNDTKKKGFYVDGHERDDVVAARSIFCRRYLIDYEPYCMRWVQLSVNEANLITGIDIDCGY